MMQDPEFRRPFPMIHPDARRLYPLEDSISYLDHGGFGVTSLEVMRVRQEMLAKIEAAPRRFFAHEHADVWLDTAARVAQRFSASLGKLALIENTTEGINAVVRSFAFEPGDEIVTTTLTYGAVKEMVGHIARERNIKVVQAEFRFPDPDPAQCLQALEQALTPRAKLAILDHVTSGTGLVLPIAEMIRLCRKRNVAICVDGAHAPGQVPINVAELDADWYVANLHKWYGVPRGCGFLWAAPGREKRLMPAVLSWDLEKDFPLPFSWTGTRDPTPWLSIPAAFDFMDREFTEQGLREHNRRLVMDGGKLLAEAWGTKISTPENMTGSMLIVPMPEDLSYPRTDHDRKRLQEDLSDAGIITCVPSYDDQRHYLRIAAYAYNRIEDFDRLARQVQSMRA
jgi:isopenicillin-N epimerase